MTALELKKSITEDAKAVLEQLEMLLLDRQETALLNTVFILKGELAAVQRANMQGTLRYEDYSRKLNAIKLNTLNVIDEVPSHFFEVRTAPQSTTENSHFAFLEVTQLVRELVDLAAEVQQNRDESFLRANLNQKRAVIVNQISKLIALHHFTLSGIEYQIIAGAFHGIADYDKAAEFYQKAVQSIDEYTESAVSKISSIRSFAHFLYQTNRPEAGKKEYESALLNADNEQAHVQNGITYQMQFHSEVECRRYEAAVESFRAALTTFQTVGNPETRNQLIRDLKSQWFRYHALTPYERPFVN